MKLAMKSKVVTMDENILHAALVGCDVGISHMQEMRAEVERRLGFAAGERIRMTGTAQALAADATSKPGKRVVSVEGRKRMAAAQKKRWAAFHQVRGNAVPKKKSAGGKKRVMSAEGRKRIAEATKKRWAEYRKQKLGPASVAGA